MRRAGQPQHGQDVPPAIGYLLVSSARPPASSATFNAEIAALGQQLQGGLDQHPDAAIDRSQPGLGDVLGARVLGEFGDDAARYANARARKNYAGNSPITRDSGKKKTVIAQWVRNRRLADPLVQHAFSALTCSPGARAYYKTLRARGIGHHAALRQLSNRLVGILHGCLKNRTLYAEATAWAGHEQHQRPA